MMKYNPKNERIKRNYFRYQKEAARRADTTIDGTRKALGRFEEYIGNKDFAAFNKEQAIAFKKHLSNQKNQRTGEPISKSTALSTLNALKEFFIWLAWQPGYKSKLHVPDIEYFNLTDKEISIAKTSKFKPIPTIEQIRHVVQSMPIEIDIQRRNRALIAFTVLTGMRDGALASLRLKHVDVIGEHVKQEPDMVNTKFSKRIDTFFFPVGDDFKSIVVDWIKELREVKLYGDNAPVFPRTKNGHDENQCFIAQGLESECWSTATPIRQIFKDAFIAAGLPYFNPHSFRHTLVCLGEKLCKDAETFKVWSQNLGHESVLTTYTSYGNVPVHRQGEVLKKLSNPEPEQDLLREIHKMMKNNHIIQPQTI